MTAEKRLAKEVREFLWMAQAGLVLRGYNRERDIPDPILRKVWRLGRRIRKEMKR